LDEDNTNIYLMDNESAISVSETCAVLWALQKPVPTCQSIENLIKRNETVCLSKNDIERNETRLVNQTLSGNQTQPVNQTGSP